MCVVVVVFVFVVVFVVVVVVVVSETQIRSMRIRGAPLIAIVDGPHCRMGTRWWGSGGADAGH
jgi:hypothetical protein